VWCARHHDFSRKVQRRPKPTPLSATPLKVVPYFNLAPLENAMVRLKESAKAYDKALLDKRAGSSRAVKGQLVALAGKTEQALTAKALNAYFDRLDEGVAMMGGAK